MYININIYIYIYIYIHIYSFSVRTLLFHLRNRHLKMFLYVLPWCPLLIADHIFRKIVSLILFRHKFYQNLACGAHFQFSNHGLFGKVDWD